jgi:mRNA turnover protein 4
MPKSKRDKKISLTQTRRKGLELKQKIIDEIRECLDQYTRIFTFSVHNMRNNKLKDVRQEWRNSRFFFGKNRVMSVALGKGPEDEYRDNLHKISQRLVGQHGLLFTNCKKDEVLKWFNEYHEADFARSGNTATQTVVIEQGPLKAFTHSMEPQLRQLGLPTSLQRGVVTLREDYTVCKNGDNLTPEQARILKLFQHKMAEFKITIESMWQNDGTFEIFTNQQQDLLHASKVRIKPKEREEWQKDLDDDELGFEAIAADDDGAQGQASEDEEEELDSEEDD